MSKQVPNVKFVIRPEKDFITITTDDIFKNKNIVLFALAIEDPIKPNPIIVILLNIKNFIQSF